MYRNKSALLYLGAGLGMLVVRFVGDCGLKDRKEAKLTKKELPYVIAMVVLDIAAPILLMFGLLFSESAFEALAVRPSS